MSKFPVYTESRGLSNMKKFVEWGEENRYNCLNSGNAKLSK